MSNITQYLKTAFEYKNNGSYKEAIDFFYKALALDNESNEILCELAHLYEKLYQNERAIELYEQILQKSPNDNSVKFDYALLNKKIKKYDKAENLLTDLLNTDYDKNAICKELFEIYSLKKEYDKIKSYYNKCSNYIKNSVILNYIGLAYLNTGDKNIAEDFFKKAFILDKNNIEAGINIAEVLFDKNMYKEAEDIIMQLLKYSENDTLFYLLGEIYYIKNDIDNAIKYYSYAIKLNDKKALYYFKAGIAFSLKGFLKEAEECYSSAMAIEPEKLEYSLALAYLYYLIRKFDLLEKIIDKILKIDTENIMALSLKLILLIKENESVEAEKVIEKIIDKENKTDFVYYALAKYYEKLNIWEKAVISIKRAIEINPSSIEYLYKLAEYNFNLLKYEDCIKICNNIILVNPKYVQVYILLAKINMHKGSFDEVKQNINKIFLLDKNISEAYYILAEVNFIQKNYDKALENYKIAVSMNPGQEKYYAKIAKCYYLLENYKTAYSYYKEASDIDITNPDYKYYMAKCSINNNDEENALSNFSIMKRLAPANIKYITEYADYVASKGKINRAVSILNSLVKELNNTEEKEKIKKYIKNLKKGS